MTAKDGVILLVALVPYTLSACQSKTAREAQNSDSLAKRQIAQSPAEPKPARPPSPISKSPREPRGGDLKTPCALPRASACVMTLPAGPIHLCEGTRVEPATPEVDARARQLLRKACESRSGRFIADGHCPKENQVVSYIQWSKMPRQTQWSSPVYKVYYTGDRRAQRAPKTIGQEQERLYEMAVKRPFKHQPKRMFKCSPEGAVLKSWTAEVGATR